MEIRENRGIFKNLEDFFQHFLYFLRVEKMPIGFLQKIRTLMQLLFKKSALASGVRPCSGTHTPGSALRAGATRRSPAQCVVVIECASLRSALFSAACAWFARRALFFAQQVLLLPQFVDAFNGNVCVACGNDPSVSRQPFVPGVDINVSPTMPFDWPRDHPQ